MKPGTGVAGRGGARLILIAALRARTIAGWTIAFMTLPGEVRTCVNRDGRPENTPDIRLRKGRRAVFQAGRSRNNASCPAQERFRTSSGLLRLTLAL